MAETCGSIIDKINVIGLKIYHNKELLATPSIEPEKKKVLENRIAVLEELLRDLSQELNLLLEDLRQGRKKLKVYRQFKMYGQKNP